MDKKEKNSFSTECYCLHLLHDSKVNLIIEVVHLLSEQDFFSFCCKRASRIFHLYKSTKSLNFVQAYLHS